MSMLQGTVSRTCWTTVTCPASACKIYCFWISPGVNCYMLCRFLSLVVNWMRRWNVRRTFNFPCGFCLRAQLERVMLGCGVTSPNQDNLLRSGVSLWCADSLQPVRIVIKSCVTPRSLSSLWNLCVIFPIFHFPDNCALKTYRFIVSLIFRY